MKKNEEFRLKSVSVKGFFGQDFSLTIPEDTDDTPIFFIGENGSFKSMFLEIIYSIFASFDAPSIIERYKINYEIEYRIDIYDVKIIKVGRHYDLTVFMDGEEFISVIAKTLDTLRNRLKKHELLPARVLSFYSGENDRLKELSSVALRGYYSTFHAELSEWMENKGEFPIYLPTRRYVHGDNEIIPIFLAMSMSHNHARRLLRKYCQIQSLELITFKTDLACRTIKYDGNPAVLAKRIFSMIDPAIARGIQIKKLPEGKYNVNLFLNNKTYNAESLYGFYEKVITIYSGVITTHFSMGKKYLSDTALSQGQRQWAKIIGMLVLANTPKSLILMDEPDVFMNPVWKYEFTNNIKSMTKAMRQGTVIIVTHDPLIINGVKKENIRRFELTRDTISINTLDQDTYGLGIDGILRSQYYGLKTTFDQQTSEKFYRRMLLYAKALDGKLTDKAEKRELFELTKELGMLPAFSSSVDYLYLDFLKVYKATAFARKQYLTANDIREKNDIIRGIIDLLFKEHGGE